MQKYKRSMKYWLDRKGQIPSWLHPRVSNTVGFCFALISLRQPAFSRHYWRPPLVPFIGKHHGHLCHRPSEFGEHVFYERHPSVTQVMWQLTCLTWGSGGVVKSRGRGSDPLPSTRHNAGGRSPQFLSLPHHWNGDSGFTAQRCWDD